MLEFLTHPLLDSHTYKTNIRAMNNDKSFLESAEFRNLLGRYEQMKQSGASSYFDISELGDLISYYLTNNNPDEAEEVYNLALRLHPQSDDTDRMKARILLAQGYPENALEAASKLNNDNDTLLLRADIHLALKQYKEARIAARKVLHNSNITDEIAYDALEIMLDCGFAQEVLDYTTEGLRHYPNNRSLLEVLAEALIEQQKTDRAIEIYNHLLDENPYSTFYWEQLGHIYYMIGRYGKALECFEYELTIETDIEYAIMMQGFCYYKLRDYKRSKEIFTTFKEKYPDSIIPRFYIALSYSNMNDKLSALEEYNEILMVGQEKEDFRIGIMLTLINQAIIYLKEGETDTAVRCMDYAIAQEMPADEMKQLLIGGRDFYELKYKENMTFEEINSTEFKEWNHYELLFALATTLIRLECNELALLPLAKAHSLAPDSSEIDAYIAYLLFNGNRNREMAEEMTKNAIEGKSNKLFELFGIPYNANISAGEFIRLIEKKLQGC